MRKKNFRPNIGLSVVTTLLLLSLLLGIYIAIKERSNYFKESYFTLYGKCLTDLNKNGIRISKDSLRIISQYNSTILNQNRKLITRQLKWAESETAQYPGPITMETSPFLCFTKDSILKEWSPIDTIKNLNLSYITFNKCYFSKYSFQNCNFEFSDFEGCTFSECSFINCNFSNTKINSYVTNGYFEKCNLFGSTFRPVCQSAFLTVRECDLEYCNFDPVNLDSVRLYWSDNYNLFKLRIDNASSENLKQALKKISQFGDIKYLDARQENLDAFSLKYRDWYFKHYVSGNFLNDYGTNSIKPLSPIFILFPLFYLVYLIYSYKNSIFLTWQSSLRDKSKNKNAFLESINKVVKGNISMRATLLFFFTVQSCFSFGFSWKAINIASLFKLIQTRDIEFKKEGSIRWIIAIHSIIFYYCLIMCVKALI